MPAQSRVLIRSYKDDDETGWLRCRALSFLNTAYYDDVYREKERYDNPAIELVADLGGEVLGIIDVECEPRPGDLCSASDVRAGMVWHVAVHPDHYRKGIGTLLLNEAARLASEKDIVRFEAWTRDDSWVCDWYESRGFVQQDSYLHVYIDGDENTDGTVASSMVGLKPLRTYAQFVGSDEDKRAVAAKYRRVHECRRYDLRLT